MASDSKCNKKEISDLLPWYVTGNLSEIEKTKVEQHLEKCPICKKELERIKWVSEGFYESDNAINSKHIDSRLLTVYSESKKGFKKEVLQRIESHLSTCKQCRNELKVLTNVNQSLEESENETVFTLFKLKLNRIINGLILKPAFAYFLLLLLLYPASLGLFKKNAPGGYISEPLNLNQLYILKGNDQRTTGKQINEIKIGNTSRFFALSFVIPINNQNSNNYVADIINSDKKVIWKSNNLTFIDEYGTAVIICPLKYFPKGNYILTVFGKPESPEDIKNTYTFKFEIITDD